ncbi:hypothetical protein [Wielerella bovis]|uniref:hypothetical protein n=1 Tax=Wielerella bovis TaxID=2917790 RepID=UPI002019BB5D|nr:hypothetical protein [Wielerella bovis]ULJ67714.1 hypothetical protein MIS31_03975 [Wielerella bovis]
MIYQNYGKFLYAPNTKVVVAHVNHKSLQLDEANIALYGYSLIDILLSESEIKFNPENNQIILSRLFTSNPHNDATRLIGNIAEVLVTKFCKQYPEVNRILGMYARNAVKLSDSLDNYIAVATGSQQTRYNYSMYYSPNDTQKDIIWLHKDNLEHQLLCIGSTSQSGKPAGLQVKTSHDYQYVLSSIKKYHYPILYFDLNNDWSFLYRALDKSDNLSKLIPHDDITHEIKIILIQYFNLLLPVFSGEYSLQYLIDMSKYEGYIDILKGLELSDLSHEKKL